MMTLDLRTVDLLALLERDTLLRRVAGTWGGEFAGPCPWCGGTDRFRAWPNGERPHWWCRGCERSGDAIDYLRQRHGMSFREAVVALGGTVGSLPASRPLQAHPEQPPAETPPSPTWQARAKAFSAWAEAQLLSPGGAVALANLKDRRGLTEDTIRRWHLGFNPSELHDKPERWGLERRGSEDRGIWLPRGVVIPCLVAKAVWYVKIRRADGSEPKYVNVRGGVRALFGADTLEGQSVALVSEGELDALLACQGAAGAMGVVTLGSAIGTIATHWLWQLRKAQRIFVAYDADQAGKRGAESWGALSGRVRVVTVPGGAKDITEAHRAGHDIGAWLRGLHEEQESWARGLPPEMVAFIRSRIAMHKEALAALPPAKEAEPCQVCGVREVSVYREDGAPLCSAHEECCDGIPQTTEELCHLLGKPWLAQAPDGWHDHSGIRWALASGDAAAVGLVERIAAGFAFVHGVPGAARPSDGESVASVLEQLTARREEVERPTEGRAT